MSDSTHGYLPGRRTGPLRYESAEVRNGWPESRPYVRDDGSAREAEVATLVAEAKRRALELKALPEAEATA